MRRERPTPDHLRRLVADGLTPKQIAERLGVGRSTVGGWLKDAKIANPTPGRQALGAWGDGHPTVGRMPARLKPSSERMGG